jgi:hypothetical protein
MEEFSRQLLDAAGKILPCRITIITFLAGINILLGIRGRLHAYESEYDFMHDLHASQIGVQFFI